MFSFLIQCSHVIPALSGRGGMRPSYFSSRGSFADVLDWVNVGTWHMWGLTHPGSYSLPW